MNYFDIYKRRMNRYGLDYQSRVQAQRDRNFEDYLLKSIYRVDFWLENEYTPATLERYKQDYSETQCYLLTKRDVKIPNGTVLMIESRDGSKKPWMVWWVEEIEASGYNRYVVLKMTHLLSWRNANGEVTEQWAYFSGPGTSAISDTIKSSTGEALYKQNDNLHTFITSYNQEIKRDLYFEVSYKETKNAYVVVETEVNSTPGVEYVSVDPSFVRDFTKAELGDATDSESFWFNGGQ